MKGNARFAPPRFRVRLSDDDEPELWCGGCNEWLPISIEFWPARDRFWHCRACEAERSRLYQAQRAFDPEHRMKNIRKSRRYRAYLMGIDPALLDIDEAVHREGLALEARAKRARAASTEQRLSYKAAWKRDKRAEARAA